MKKKVVLIHGYNKSSKDMLPLKKNMERLGYECILVDLPLRFKEVDYCTSVFEKKIKGLLRNLNSNEKISIIGHSTGGLIIRYYLSKTKYIDKIGRCVLIATPNKGSQLADIASRFSKVFINILKTLKSLTTEEIKKLGIKEVKNVEIGAIAGNNNNLLLGKLLKEENDGRVRVSSVKYKGLKDFIILPYGHKEIHHKFKTAKLVDSFIRNGKFYGD
ncbi:alpha/beta fold hydrolase [Thermohalobacter berrensis]|uniref:Alpha/beta hydrolase n=1 Tax=Thermohalobacter berrensis TaxID=99594 RepID=A0A419SXM9_9FIRM|nr:alpha/beta fold hydrolase [Thermohalobacter berrensis]RKD30012.1 alpha/beta hydrolase [Thermohalobacter berrensis]